ncbi:methyl-accepting chemotaxis protein [Desulfonema magnum]|uniref:Methyl-accepting chemotaxis protein signailing-domain containing protein n=1 Tax=Desulfonema magnum TaxID=45655 RepID=A0A975BMD3_9BACT|nr:methyl-accepting chemotaxis protein [Desulfonema magnum]QTA88354.1 Methyl-accepting chemotaxis protein signailing-domain containing protein [Desulfonema magnum]
MKYYKKGRTLALLFKRYKAWLFKKIFSLSFMEKGRQKLSAHTESELRASEITTISLSVLANSLEATCKHVEPKFIRLGQDIESVYFEATTLSQQTLETVRLLGGGSEEDPLVKIEQVAKESLADFKNYQAQILTDIDHVSRVIRHLGDLYKICEMVKKIGMFLRVVGLNIGVESSRSAQFVDMFTVVSHETLHLSEKIIKIGENIREDAEATRNSQMAVHDKISDALSQLRKVADGAQEAVKNSGREIEQLMRFSLEVLEQAGAHTQEVSHQIGEIVAGIQIHDSMSQRISHIINALYDVEQFCAEKPSDHKDTKKFCDAYTIVGIQCAQLKQTISDIEKVYDKSLRAFGKIHEEVGRLIHSLSGFGLSGSDNGSSLEFEVLQSALLDLHQLLSQGTGLVEGIHATALEASETTARLSGYIEHVREISFETHLVALNAIVKALHLGEGGRTLEVLAGEVKSLSDQSNLFATRVAEILESVSASVQAMGTCYIGEARGTENNGSLDMGIQDITRAYEQYRTDSSALFQRAETLNDAITKIISTLDFLPALAEELRGQLRQLEDFARMIEHRVGEDFEKLSSETKKLAKRYTMRQERGIHEKYIKQKDIPILVREEESEQEHGKKKDHVEIVPDKDDIGDNVELF